MYYLYLDGEGLHKIGGGKGSAYPDFSPFVIRNSSQLSIGFLFTNSPKHFLGLLHSYPAQGMMGLTLTSTITDVN